MPFFRLGYNGSKGSARSAPSQEDVLHFNAVRIRVNGAGNLKLSLYSLDDLKKQNLADIAMSEKAGRHYTQLANFIAERVSIEGKTLFINDYFRVNRIILFSKFYASSYPQ